MLSSTSLIALESEVVGACEEEEEGEDIWLPRKVFFVSLLSSLPLYERFCAADTKLAPFFILSLYIHSSADFTGCG